MRSRAHGSAVLSATVKVLVSLARAQAVSVETTAVAAKALANAPLAKVMAVIHWMTKTNAVS